MPTAVPWALSFVARAFRASQSNVGVFARLHRPIDFEVIDDMPVDLIFLLLAPEGAGADHLKALARIARVLRDPACLRFITGRQQLHGPLGISKSPRGIEARPELEPNLVNTRPRAIDGAMISATCRNDSPFFCTKAYETTMARIIPP